ncbi:MAG: hypothetical protein U9R51_02730 [Actinomycetota bacterium]|nr:hypothetical protein [Actinomycetota bacterium]
MDDDRTQVHSVQEGQCGCQLVRIVAQDTTTTFTMANLIGSTWLYRSK